MDSLACTYAALILADAGLPTSSENLSTLVSAAGLEVRATLPIIYSRFLEKKSVDSLVAAASAAPVAAAPVAAAAPAAGAAAKKDDKKKVVEEEEDDFGMGGLF